MCPYVPVVIYIPCVPVVICIPVSRSVISFQTIPVSRSSFIYPACAPGVPVVVVSLCPGRHLYSLCPGHDLCPGVPVRNFSLSVPVVIYIPCVPVSRYVISSVDKHDVSQQTTS